jgi:hypothetical protein
MWNVRDNMSNYIALSIHSHFYHGKIGIVLNYKCNFGLTEGKKYKRDTWASTNQREQYGGTVHLFIGTGQSLWEITSMSFTFIIDLYTNLWGLNNLFPFKSVPFSAI